MRTANLFTCWKGVGEGEIVLRKVKRGWDNWTEAKKNCVNAFILGNMAFGIGLFVRVSGFGRKKLRVFLHLGQLLCDQFSFSLSEFFKYSLYRSE